jgi:hypothetical protein
VLKWNAASRSASRFGRNFATDPFPFFAKGSVTSRPATSGLRGAAGSRT